LLFKPGSRIELGTAIMHLGSRSATLAFPLLMP